MAQGAPKKANKDDDSDEMDDGDDEEDFENTKKALAKFKNGELNDDYDDEDDDDSDYEAAGGDLDLYDSKLDDIDELNFMKDTMQVLMNQGATQMVGQTDTNQLMQCLH